MNDLWTEKYRPNTVDGYVFTDDAQRQQVQHWIKQGSIPHLLLSGSPGTGKTTLAKLLINELGVDEFDVLYSNGSKDARKLDWVDKLIGFCSTMPFGKFKVVLVDEADFMNPAERRLRAEQARMAKQKPMSKSQGMDFLKNVREGMEKMHQKKAKGGNVKSCW
jgi:DNA polymerase III delta prime subunit